MTAPRPVAPLLDGGAQAVPSLVRHMLVSVVSELEADPELAARFRAVLFPAPSIATTVSIPTNMSMREYAIHAKVSERTIRTDLKLMTVGVQYRRDGAKGRRVIIHVAEADTWRRSRARARDERQESADYVRDEVLQHRAKQALRRARSQQ